MLIYTPVKWVESPIIAEQASMLRVFTFATVTATLSYLEIIQYLSMSLHPISNNIKLAAATSIQLINNVELYPVREKTINFY